MILSSGKWKIPTAVALALGIGGTIVYEMAGWQTKARGPTGWHLCGQTALVEVWTDLPCPKQDITVAPGAHVKMIPKLAVVKKELATP